MKQTLLLVMSIFMFIITTTLLVLTPNAVGHPLDTDQKIFLGMIVGMGYLTTALYVSVYIDNRRHSNKKHQPDCF